MTAEPVKLVPEDGWVICPSCGKQKLLQLLPGGGIRKCKAYCKHCRRSIELNIDLSLSP